MNQQESAAWRRLDLFEADMRQHVVQAARSMARSGAAFADFEQTRGNDQLWRVTELGALQLRPGVSPAAGIRDIFVNGDLYAFECATATVIVLYKGILDSIEEESFNRLFADLLLYDWEYDEDLRLIQTGSSAAAMPGDVLYFMNPDVNPDTPEWQGENTIKLGPDLYFGHGIGVTSGADIIAALNENRIPDSTRTAYLTNNVHRLDFSYYYPYAKPNEPSGIAARCTCFIRVRIGQHSGAFYLE